MPDMNLQVTNERPYEALRWDVEAWLVKWPGEAGRGGKASRSGGSSRHEGAAAQRRASRTAAARKG